MRGQGFKRPHDALRYANAFGIPPRATATATAAAAAAAAAAAEKFTSIFVFATLLVVLRPLAVHS